MVLRALLFLELGLNEAFARDKWQVKMAKITLVFVTKLAKTDVLASFAP